MTLLRRVLGETLRGQRLRQRRTLREVSGAARVSLGYLSEVERGQKEASSELLASICDALDVRLSDVLRQVSDTMRRTERMVDVARAPARQLVPAGAGPASGPPPLPVGADDVEFDVDLDLPDDFVPDDLMARVGADLTSGSGAGVDRPDAEAVDAERFAPGRPNQDGKDTVRTDTDRPNQDGKDTDRTDTDRMDLDRPDLDRPDTDRRLDQVVDPDRPEPDRTSLDGVDLADLETGDGFADVDALLSLTDLSCCLAEAHNPTVCLAGAVAAA